MAGAYEVYRKANEGDGDRMSQEQVNRVFGAVADLLATGEKVSIQGFGTLTPVERAARKCHNPQGGDPIEKPAHMDVKWKAATALKDRLDTEKGKG